MTTKMPRLPVDAHVHIYKAFDPVRCLDAAARQMSAEWGNARTGILVVLRGGDCLSIEDLPGRLGNWSIAKTAESGSRIATRSDGSRLVLIDGRQLVTAERVEVLAIGPIEGPSDGLPLTDMLSALRSENAVSVLPWGVGKWSGKRLAIVERLIHDQPEANDLFLADSGVRPAAMPRPPILSDAEAKGWRVLAGTDPLPLGGEEDKPGRFGFMLPVTLGTERPLAALRATLLALGQSPSTYGHLESLPRAVRRQLSMQWRKRFGSS